MKEQKLMIILVILLIVLFMVIYIKFNYSNNNIKKDNRNSSTIYADNLKEKIEFNELIFSDISIKKEADNTLNIIVKISNDTSNDVEMYSFDILFRNNKNKILKRITAYGGMIKSGTSFLAYSSVELDLKEIYSLEFVESE